MSNVTFDYYSYQSSFDTAKSTNGLTPGGLYFIADTHKIYRATADNAAEVFSEPYEIVNNLPTVSNARYGCLYIDNTTHEIQVKQLVNSTPTMVTIVPALSSVYTYKGSVSTYANLPSSGQTTGDVYNVVAAYTDSQNNITYPAGTNFAWNGSAWDALGGNLDGYLSDTTKLEDLSNVNSAGLSGGEFLQYQAADDSMGVTAGWVPTTLALNMMSDVRNADTAGAGQVLGWSTTDNKWEPTTLQLNNTNVALGTGVNAPSNGQVLTYNSNTSKWTNTTITTGISWTEVLN